MKPFTAITPEAQELLQAYAWKGNVRQLRNVAQRLCALCDDPAIPPSAVKEALELGLEGRKIPEPHNSKGWTPQNEKERIQLALTECNFQKGQAAEQLGIDRSTLWRKMKKYHLE